MKTQIVPVLLVILLGTTLSAQDLTLSGSLGLSAMQLNELKDYQQELIDDSSIPMKGLSMFPLFTYERISLEKQFTSRVRAAFSVGHATTGAHANYTDYSGYLNLDQTLNTYLFGVTGFYSLRTFRSLDLSLMGNLSLTHTRVKVAEYIITPLTSVNNQLTLSSFSPSLLGGIELMYRFRVVAVGVEAGYLLNIGTVLDPIDDQDYPGEALEPSSEVRANSSGLRAGIKVAIPIIADDPISGSGQIF